MIHVSSAKILQIFFAAFPSPNTFFLVESERDKLKTFFKISSLEAFANTLWLSANVSIHSVSPRTVTTFVPNK